MPLYEGFLLDSSGIAVNGATVDLVDRNTSSPVRATTTTDSNGFFSIDHGTEGRFDIRITSGSDVVWRRYDTAAQMKELETATLKVRNPADTFVYDIVPGAITANRTLNLPVITGTDTLAALGLAQTFSELQTFSSGIDVTDTTDATSPTSAPVKSAGGLAVAKSAFVGERFTGQEIISNTATGQNRGVSVTTSATGISEAFFANDTDILMYAKDAKLVFAHKTGDDVIYLSIPIDGSTTSWTASSTEP